MNCQGCGQPITGRRTDALYCCQRCRDLYHYRTRIQPARARLRICPRHPETRTALTGFKQRICPDCRADRNARVARNQALWRAVKARRRELTVLQKLQP